MLRTLSTAVALAAATTAVSAQSALLITEFAVTPTAGEFVEIFNPGPDSVDLTDYYLTDATFFNGDQFYYNIVIGAPGGGSFGDFTARFPAGATIAPGEYQTVACADADGAEGFFNTYGVLPTYECLGDGGFDNLAVPDMLEGVPGSINGQGGLTNSGEMINVFYWDGESDLVTDIDYVLWGDQAESVNKSGVSIDGPDADTDPSTYADDLFFADQPFTTPPGSGSSAQRVMMSEGLETTTGSNGVGGNSETSENTDVTFENAPPTPNARSVGALDQAWTDNGGGSFTVDVTGGTPNGPLLYIFSLGPDTIPVGQCPGDGLSIEAGAMTRFIDVSLDGAGELHVTRSVAAGLGTLYMQAVDISGCRITNPVAVTF